MARRLRAGRPGWWRVEVHGPSMAPTLLAGDRLVVIGGGGLRVGDLVALRDPQRPTLVLVKRVVALGERGLHVAGDNAAASRDSRDFGPVAPAALLGRAVYRYHPADRAGRLPRVATRSPGAPE